MKGLTILFVLLASPAVASDVNVYLSGGRSMANKHGRATFRTISLELTRHNRFVDRWLPNTFVGAAVSYSDVTQPRSWFGHTYGDPDDRIRAEDLYLFVRPHFFNGAAFADIGTGPMWSNRRIPAATSRLNFDSRLTIGATLLPRSRLPLSIAYRFSHISNAGWWGRNPGWNVHSFLIGARIRTLR